MTPRRHRNTEVLVINADATQRTALERACRAVGLSVVAVSSAAEVKKWPVGQIVITDSAHLTPLWQQVGAVEVIVLVRPGEEATNVVERGATRWLQPPPPPDVVAAMALTLAGTFRLAKPQNRS